METSTVRVFDDERGSPSTNQVCLKESPSTLADVVMILTLIAHLSRLHAWDSISVSDCRLVFNLNIIIIIENWKPDGQSFAKYNKQNFSSNAFVWLNNIPCFIFTSSYKLWWQLFSISKNSRPNICLDTFAKQLKNTSIWFSVLTTGLALLSLYYIL